MNWIIIPIFIAETGTENNSSLILHFEIAVIKLQTTGYTAPLPINTKRNRVSIRKKIKYLQNDYQWKNLKCLSSIHWNWVSTSGKYSSKRKKLCPLRFCFLILLKTQNNLLERKTFLVALLRLSQKNESFKTQKNVFGLLFLIPFWEKKSEKLYISVLFTLILPSETFIYISFDKQL